jgi:hypothetical protein
MKPNADNECTNVKEDCSMRRSLVLIAAFVGLATFIAPSNRAGVNAGISIGDGGVKSFYLEVGEFFKAPAADVQSVRDARYSDDELPVILYISQRTGIRPEAIIQLRSLKKTWCEIAVHYGMSPAMFYVPLSYEPGPPFGKAYGHYKRHGKSEWKKIVLDDEDVINLVNLRFVSGYYKVPAEDVVKSRCAGKSFASISKEIKSAPPKEDKKKERAAKREKMKKQAQANKD